MLIFLMMLALVHGIHCRYTYQVLTNVEADQGLKITKYSDKFLRSVSAIRKAIKSSNSKINSIHIVSRRLVPCGPNPLHN
ncbi:hypothetical protein JCGZ_26130 [Jatropha curcas]|uniref:Uncharacterized protein n=1 Tax=Jatropha curcas TaxID=180498 RepID=A0A067JRZ2_JATCU|nr:hypothetical protein JCGZ_26130 [Jatropha curcas]